MMMEYDVKTKTQHKETVKYKEKQHSRLPHPSNLAQFTHRVCFAEHRQENIENKKMESPVNLFKNLSQIGIVEVFYSLLLRENIFCKNVHHLHL